MPVVDADAHVIETEHTWDYMDADEEKYRPVIVQSQGGDEAKYWMIDGKIRGRARGPVAARGLAQTVSRRMVTDEAKRYMEDIPGRVAHMDELGIDVQVLYPTMYINRMCDLPETEVALAKSYNRWLGDIWAQSKGRLRWTCILPLETMDQAIEQLHWSIANGCCGVTMRSVEGERLLIDDYFAPLYKEAARLNVPITVHIGNSNSYFQEILSKDGIGGTFANFRLMSVASFHQLVTTGMPKRFPGLRFGYIEASAQWIPYVVHDLRRRLETRGRKLEDDVLGAYSIWVTAQTDDDLPEVLRYASPDHLMIGTDYGHQDQSSEIDAMRNLRDMGEIDPSVAEKILGLNACAFYGIDVAEPSQQRQTRVA
jgi:predicted TIM-barrel fold metal-dependent hydrolase